MYVNLFRYSSALNCSLLNCHMTLVKKTMLLLLYWRSRLRPTTDLATI